MRFGSNNIKTKKKIKNRINILRDVAIFSESNEKIVEQLAVLLSDVYVKSNDVIFNKNDQLNAMYIIVNGKVKVHDGEHIFTEFGNKDFFGEYSLIDSSVRSATVTAIEDTHLLRLDQEDFHTIIEENPEVLKAVLNALIKRLRNNNILEEKLTQNSIKIKRQHDELEKQKKELEELNATKDKFFTIIAHDLKNPFNTVIGLAELLIERYDTYEEDKIRAFLSQIHKFSINAFNLLENLLQWAKSQTGRIEVNPEKLNLYELAIENKSLFKQKASKKGVDIFCDIQNGLFAYADRNMITTVIRNLVSNAVKFTNRGDKIVIGGQVKDDWIKVTIKDTGVGIPVKNIDQIFRIDSNITTTGTEDESGTGLGLIISREFVEQNGGTMSVESKEGQGSEFSFTIPVYKE